MISLLTQFAACGSGGFLETLLPTWHKYLASDPAGPSTGPGCSVLVELPGDIWLIAAAIFEILLRLAGIITAAYFIIGAYTVMTSSGNPDNVKKGNNTMLNSMYGLGIVVIAGATVNYLVGRFGYDLNSVGLPELNNPDGGQGFARSVLTIAFQLVGVISMLMLAIGSYKYVSSGGNPQKIATAKSTIIYAFVGLFLALSVGFIINFVVGRVT